MKKVTAKNTKNFTHYRKKYQLFGLDRNASITIERDGQENPDKGNRVKAQLKLYLPSNKQSLIQDIVFGERLEICGDFLKKGWYWGIWGTDLKSRYMKKEFLAQTWQEAFNLAMDYAKSELEKLQTALRERQQALLDAEPKEQLITELQLRELQALRAKELENSIETDNNGCTITELSSSHIDFTDFSNVFNIQDLDKHLEYAKKVIKVSEDLEGFYGWTKGPANVYINFKKKIYIKDYTRLKNTCLAIEKRIQELQEPKYPVPENLKHLL